MKKIILYLLVFIPVICFSQNWVIPTIDWHGQHESENKYVDLLKLKDTNALIVKIGYSSYWTKGVNAQFIVYQNDGQVTSYVTFQPKSTELKPKIKRKKIKKKEYQYYWDYLQKCAKEKMFEIDETKLNITQKEDEKEGTIEVLNISDGTNYQLEICLGKNYISYHSYSPKNYIENEFPGSEERQKLIDLMNGFEQLLERR